MIRDTYSKALVETDVAELNRYRKEKQKDKEFQQLKNDVIFLKERINNLSKTLQQIEAKCE